MVISLRQTQHQIRWVDYRASLARWDQLHHIWSTLRSPDIHKHHSCFSQDSTQKQVVFTMILILKQDSEHLQYAYEVIRLGDVLSNTNYIHKQDININSEWCDTIKTIFTNKLYDINKPCILIFIKTITNSVDSSISSVTKSSLEHKMSKQKNMYMWPQCMSWTQTTSTQRHHQETQIEQGSFKKFSHRLRILGSSWTVAWGSRRASFKKKKVQQCRL